jgi:hypothetical protein
MPPRPAQRSLHPPRPRAPGGTQARWAYLQRTGSPARPPPEGCVWGGRKPSRALHVASAGALTAKGRGTHDEARSNQRGPIPQCKLRRGEDGIVEGT